MSVNKLAALSAIVLALSAGVAQAAVTSANVGITATVAPSTTACTLSGPAAIAMGAIANGIQSSSLLNTTATCTAAAPYSYSFSSLNGGATGKLVSGTCSLSYNIVSYTVNGGLLGATNYFVTPVPAIAGSGLAQVTNFAVVVPAAQPGCILAANAAPLTVADTLIVSINY